MRPRTAHKAPPSPWWVAIVCGMASYIDAAAIVSSGTALVLYQQTLGVTGGQIGILSAALTLSIAIGALTGGRLGDRFGRRKVFIVTMAMVVIGCMLLVLAPGFAGLFAGTVLLGLGSGADLPVSLSTISEAASSTNRGKLLGFSQIFWFGGILATNALSAIIGGLGQLGGQILFGHVGIVALAVLVLRVTIPESTTWSEAHTERASGVDTVRAQRTGIKDVLGKKIFLIPFLALLVFYTLTNIGANTGGQFGTYIAVNVVGLSVQVNSLIGIFGMPLGMLWGLWFMRIVDGRLRMHYFVFGAICLVVSYLLPVLLGFSIPVWLAMQVLNGLGGAFAFEAIMKVWSQESFPTLLRSSVQGSIIAVARVVAAGVALVTPALATTPKLLYGSLTAVVLIGVTAGWLGFRNSRFSTFDIEEKNLADAQAALSGGGLRADSTWTTQEPPVTPPMSAPSTQYAPTER
ncbi:MFS transporter [Brachybacterium sacelli]|uniref:Inositol transporter-like SP family MFS transporter n=2 Tax=Brachybacterium sacelli TaxID=173364 RepID=A0ABS4WW26_9MICO|nr:inositol transporter-like SP family MFS transporter [Brachybacterium sacelli]